MFNKNEIVGNNKQKIIEIVALVGWLLYNTTVHTERIVYRNLIDTPLLLLLLMMLLLLLLFYILFNFQTIAV